MPARLPRDHPHDGDVHEWRIQQADGHMRESAVTAAADTTRTIVHAVFPQRYSKLHQRLQRV